MIIRNLIAGGIACALGACATSDFAENESFGGEVGLLHEAVQIAAEKYPDLVNYRFESVTTRRAAFSAAPATLPTNHEAGAFFASPQKIAPLITDAPLRYSVQEAREGGWREFDEYYVHDPSGLTCKKNDLMMAMDDAGIKLIPLPLAGIQLYKSDGSDTSCNYVNNEQGVYITIYVSRWPDVSLDNHFAAALADISKAMTLKEETTAIVAGLDEEEDDASYDSTIEGETKAAAFLLEPINGQQFKTILWLNRTGNWHVKMRGTIYVGKEGATPEFSFVELLAAAMFEEKLKEVDRQINSGALTQVRF